MYNQPYFIPRFFASTPPVMMRGALGRAMGGALGGGINGARLATGGATRGLGLFSRLSNSMRAIKGINWGSLITNTSKTLNVVNQAIPLVRQVGPMMNNMRSMLRIASIFKDETDVSPPRKKQVNSNINNTYNNISSKVNNTITSNNNLNNYSYSNYDDNSPTFFINT